MIQMYHNKKFIHPSWSLDIYIFYIYIKAVSTMIDCFSADNNSS
jgi:hypothetical protein